MENGSEFPYKLKLIRGAKGKYRWEITVQLHARSDIVSATSSIDTEVKAKYGDVSE